MGSQFLVFWALAMRLMRIFTGKVDAKGMGLTPEHLRMFGLLAVIQTLGWALVVIGLRMGASWPHSLAIFNTGLFTFDYLSQSRRRSGILVTMCLSIGRGVALLLQFLYILCDIVR